MLISPVESLDDRGVEVFNSVAQRLPVVEVLKASYYSWMMNGDFPFTLKGKYYGHLPEDEAA